MLSGHNRRVGQIDAPDQLQESDLNNEPKEVPFSSSLPEPLNKEVYDNIGALDKWKQEKSESLEITRFDELRKDSVSSIKKQSSPLRRLSSPLRKSGRLSFSSITGKFSKRSSADAVNLMSSLATSPTNLTSPTSDGPFSLAPNTIGEPMLVWYLPSITKTFHLWA